MVYYTSYGWDDKINGVHFTAEKANAMNTSKKKMPTYTYVPEEWGMYTTRGNRRIANLAQEFITRLANGVEPLTAARCFCQSFARLYKTKTMAEASDTDVRDQVWSFLERFSPLNRCTFQMVWDRECA